MTVVQKRKNNWGGKAKKVRFEKERRTLLAKYDSEAQSKKEARKRLGNSAGSMMTIFSFFSMTDQLKFQALSRRFYSSIVPCMLLKGGTYNVGKLTIVYSDNVVSGDVNKMLFTSSLGDKDP